MSGSIATSPGSGEKSHLRIVANAELSALIAPDSKDRLDAFIAIRYKRMPISGRNVCDFEVVGTGSRLDADGTEPFCKVNLYESWRCSVAHARGKERIHARHEKALPRWSRVVDGNAAA